MPSTWECVGLYSKNEATVLGTIVGRDRKSIEKQTRRRAHRRQMAGRGQMVKMAVVARTFASSPGLCVESVGQKWAPEPPNPHVMEEVGCGACDEPHRGDRATPTRAACTSSPVCVPTRLAQWRGHGALLVGQPENSSTQDVAASEVEKSYSQQPIGISPLHKFCPRYPSSQEGVCRGAQTCKHEATVTSYAAKEFSSWRPQSWRFPNPSRL